MHVVEVFWSLFHVVVETTKDDQVFLEINHAMACFNVRRLGKVESIEGNLRLRETDRQERAREREREKERERERESE